MTETNDLLDLILAQLVAILLHVPGADSAKARAAARQAIGAYSPQSAAEPIDIAQIVALAFTALDTLRLAAPEDVTLTLKLKLRGNAVAMSRASKQATEALHRNRLFADPVWVEPDDEPEAAAQPAAPADPEPRPAVQPAAEPVTQQPWASAMTGVANDLQARADKVSPAQQHLDRLWIEALNGTASTLSATAPNRGQSPTGQFPTGQSPNGQSPNGQSRAGLMRTTLMSGGAVLPPGLGNPAK